MFGLANASERENHKKVMPSELWGAPQMFDLETLQIT